ncbi:MAG: 2'-5' RNA ligase family protein, partial [Candidatus Thorarchaeota archaeon]
MEVYRLFIAIEIENQDCKNTLKEIQDLLPDISLKLVSVENLHLTLKFLGDTEKSLIPEIIKNLTT